MAGLLVRRRICVSEGFQREEGSMEVVRSKQLVTVRVRVRVRKGKAGKEERKQNNIKFELLTDSFIPSFHPAVFGFV